MTLQALLPDMSLANPELTISGITDDSRRVVDGDLVIAVSGANYTAQQLVDDIAMKSVATVLHDASEALNSSLPLVAVPNLAPRRSEIAGRYFDHPSRKLQVVAVTGTNGKTSCTQFVAGALEVSCGVIGTLGYGFVDSLKEPGLTTPDAISIQRMLAEFVEQDAKAVSIEASSHGLVQGRLDGIEIHTAVFTNVTRDHLDYHKTFDAYKAAKNQLFHWPGLTTAILNWDDDFSSEIRAGLADDVQVFTYSTLDSSADIFCIEASYSLEGIQAKIASPWGEVQVSSTLLGQFNLSNLLSVIAVLGSRGVQTSEISRRVSALTNVPGRMERLPLSSGAMAIIDYAHTPNALENALSAARVHCDGQLWSVMGCGGDRDVGKRPIMGEITSRLADVSVITDDNPRTEASEQIIEDILAGTIKGADVRVESDRREAIRQALAGAKAGDIVLIAGKGHETYQEIDGVRQEFSDLAEVLRFESEHHERGA